MGPDRLHASAATCLAVSPRMRAFALVTLVAFGITATGCAIHQQMPRPLTPAAVAQVHDALASRGAWIEFSPPGFAAITDSVQQGNVRRIEGSPPSLVLHTDECNAEVPIESVRNIQVNNHSLGALEGLGAGFLGGILVGATLASGGESHCAPADDHCLGMDFSGEILLSSIVIGSLTGLVIGASVGQRFVYTF